MVRETEYYDILEVHSSCTETELKKSYRRLCLIHHPDKQASNSSTPADSTKFQSIQNAYEVLSDPEKRESYDAYGKEPRGGRGGGGGGGDMDDIFASMFGGGGGGGRGHNHGPAGGRPEKKKTQTEPSVVKLSVTLEELYNGKEKKMDIQRSRKCGTCAGTGAKPKTKPRPCNQCEGKGMVYAIRQMGPFAQRVAIECPDCDGTGSKIRAQDACKKCKGAKINREKSRIEFYVERGAHPGSKIVLPGQGDESADSSAPGDLYIILAPTAHATFTLLPPSSSSSPQNLQTTLSITLSESLLGFSRLILIHLDGRGLRVNMPKPGMKGWRILKTGDEVCVKEEGMWKAGRRGLLRIKIEVEMPGKDWAAGIGRDELELLLSLLPPKRADVDNPEETDEVELEPYHAEKHAEDSGEGYEDDSDEMEDQEAGCQQQ